jgi:DNA-binding SARP family transcriptional activator/tetratricopeptide (TPR) repeat protein
MEVRLLGPLEVTEGGRPIACGGARQGAVLALLVLHANAVVPSERLLVELWGQEAPPSAANALQAAVSRLRRALPRGRLVTRAPGYLFRASPDELDLDRFERLLARGRQALASGAAAEAARTLRQALSVWRGPALADFRYEPFAQAEIARLEELRLVCLEERIEADLAIGAGSELVGELQRLVTEQPLRERPRSQLMLALYRSGRQAEALAAYREFRSLLREELGLDPAPVLRELEAAILRHDPALQAAPAAAPAAALAPARKPVTVLCAELRAASSSGASLDPEALGVVLARALAILSSTLERHGGKLAAAASERIIGVFGVPTLHEDDALRAAQAALAGQSALQAEAADMERERDLRLGIRIGLATGEALVGGPDPPGFAGEAVAQAVGLAESAAAGEILVSEQTRELAAGAIEVEPAGSGRLRLLAARTGARPLPVRLDAPLVDRSQELGRLREAFARVARKRAPLLATVLGEAGIGKTRLVYELAVRVAEEATVLTGRCLPYGEGITFWPLRELVHQAGAGQEAQEELEALLQDEADAVRVAERLAGALGPSEHAASEAAEIFWATRRLLETLARRRPLLVVFEDLHWAEPTFLDLVESVAIQAGQAPLLLLCLARPELLEQRPDWAAGLASSIIIQLEPLTDGDATAMLDALAGPPSAPAHRRLLEAAAGNPLFLEQLAASLGEQRWGEDGLPLPATIQALLAARLELLGPGERAVLWRAAIVGKDFSLHAIAELMPAEARRLLGRHLQALIAKGLVQARPSRGRTGEDFTFRHILVQQAAYRAIPKSLRAELHERFADWFERRAGERPGEYDELLGYHLEQAVRYRGELAPRSDEVRALARRAAGCLEAAGVRAHARGDVSAAVHLLQRASSLLERDDPVLARVLTGLGAALTEAGRLDRAAVALDNAQRVAAVAGDESLGAHARIQQLFLGLQVDVQRAMAVAAVGSSLPGMLRIFEHHADELGLCQAWRLRAAVRWMQANSAAAEDAWQRAAVHARRAGDERQLTEVLGWLASAALWGPTPAPEGIRRCERFLAEVGSRTGEAVILNHLAGLYAMQDQVARAHELLARGRAIFDDLGATMTSAVTEPASFVAMLTGDAAAAETCLRRDYDRLERMGEKVSFAITAALLAKAIAAQGRHEEAERFVAVSRDAGGGEDFAAQVTWQGVLARILTARGRLVEAERLAREAVALAARTDMTNDHGDAQVELARVLAAAGRATEARAAVREALDLYERKGNLLAAASARRRLERLPLPMTQSADPTSPTQRG